MTEHLAKAKEFHRERIQPLLGEPIGVSEGAVDELESKVGATLPAAYREFLLWMGADEHGALQGTDCFARHVNDNNAWLPDLLSENDVDFELPKRPCVFFMHQGYIAAWFDLDACDDDPQCWMFSEGETPEPAPIGRFSDFWLEQLKGLLPAIEAVVGGERPS